MEPDPPGWIRVRLEFHEEVAGDVLSATAFYEKISPRLASDFERELQGCLRRAAAEPFRCQPELEFRRINLKRFPYHLLFSVEDDLVRIMVVRHNKRRPSFGVDRFRQK